MLARAYLWVCLAGYASAATYHVTQAGAGSADGSSLANAYSVAGHNAATFSASDVVILNGTLTSTVVPPSNGVTYQFADGAMFSKPFWGTTTGAAIYASSRSNITIDGLGVGIIECTANGDALANEQPSHGIYTTLCTGWTVRNLIIRNIFTHTFGEVNPVGVPAYSTIGWKGEDCSGLTMHGCTVSNAYVAAYWLLSFAASRSGYTIYSNTISACSTAIVVATSSASSTMSNVDVYLNDVTMGRNWFDPPNDNHVDGLHCWALSGGLMSTINIYRNYFHGDPGTQCTGQIFLEGNITPILIHNNLIVSSVNRQNGGAIGPNVPAGGVCRIYNNTVVGLGSTNTGGLAISLDMTSTSTAHITNNILKNNFVGIYDPNNTGTIVSDYNDFHGNGNVGWRASGQTTLAGWRTASGGDANSINTDPLLDGSYNIPTGSPAKDAGSNLNAYFTIDRVGTTRPQGSAWDIGSFEFVTAVAPTAFTRMTIF